jgi:predicted  nucleic acid-binding Zn-ribbon protein
VTNFDFSQRINEIYALGQALFMYITPLLKEVPLQKRQDLEAPFEKAFSNLSAIHTAYKQVPVGFSEVLDNANALSEVADVVLNRLAEFGLSRPAFQQAQELLSNFRVQVETDTKQYFHSSVAVNSARGKLDHDVLAQLDFFKLRISETNSALAKQEKRTEEIEDFIQKLNLTLIDISSLADDLRLRIDEKVAETTKYLAGKQTEVNEVVGIIAAKSIVGSYEKSADIEKSSADNLRTGAVVFMVLVMIFVAVTFYEITTGDFSWEKSALKLICSLLFSVPAAYLARESAKHRQQQYTHLQTALDLKAIGPYISTLPKEKQDELKTDIAQKIFAPKTFDHVTKESYPINAQELVLALVDRINDRKPGLDSETKP